MTSRQRVLRALNFDHPDRVPRQLWTLPGGFEGEPGRREAIEAMLRRWPQDIGWPSVPGLPRGRLERGDRYAPGASVDRWGCVFVNIQPGVHGEVKDPILADWSRLEDLRTPEETLALPVESINAFCRATDRFILAGGARLFERIQFLRGSENVFMDLAEDAPELHELLRIVHDFNCREMEAWAATDVDGLFFLDDWGSQRSLLIDPGLWRRLFKPCYADYVRIAHDAGKKIFMHSDGWIFDLYEELIEIGIDAINSQLFCMPIEEIGRRFAGRITFWGEIDRQHLLPFGTPDEIAAAMARLERTIYRPEGGVIAQFEMGPGARMDNMRQIWQAWDDISARHAAAV